MKRLIIILGSAALGLAICLTLIALSHELGIGAQFPSPRGETDFSARAAYFFFGVCPAFLLLGGWIGYVGQSTLRTWISMWAGTLVGSAVVFVALHSARGQVESLSAGSQATYAVVVFFAAWVAASVGGAILLRRLFRKKAKKGSTEKGPGSIMKLSGK
jgi:hypothetical protein